MPESDLSDYEARVAGALRTLSQQPKAKNGVSFEEICAETLLSPDIVTHVIAVLVQKGMVTVVGETPPADLRLLAS